MVQSMHSHCGPDILGLLSEPACSCSVCIAVKAMYEEILVLSQYIQSRR